MGLLGIHPIGLQSQTIWRLISQVPVLKAGVLFVEFACFASQEEALNFSLLPIVGHCTGGGVYSKIVSQPFLTPFDAVSLVCLT